MLNWKGFGRKWSWPNLRSNPGICIEGLRKTTKNLSQDSWSPGRDLNTGPPKYEAGNKCGAGVFIPSSSRNTQRHTTTGDEHKINEHNMNNMIVSEGLQQIMEHEFSSMNKMTETYCTTFLWDNTVNTVVYWQRMYEFCTLQKFSAHDRLNISSPWFE
jgi:hypothetical protein